jgi:hypothetical protein
MTIETTGRPDRNGPPADGSVDLDGRGDRRSFVAYALAITLFTCCGTVMAAGLLACFPGHGIVTLASGARP